MAKVMPSARVVGFAIGSLRSQSQLTSGRASEGPWIDDLWLAPFAVHCNLYHVRRFVKGCEVMEIAQFCARDCGASRSLVDPKHLGWRLWRASAQKACSKHGEKQILRVAQNDRCARRNHLANNAG